MDELNGSRVVMGHAAPRLKVRSRRSAGAVVLLLLGSACAEGTEQTQLDPGLLNNAGSSAGPAGGMATAGSSAVAGNPGAGGTSAGTSAVAGAAGSAAGSGGAPLGGAGGKGGAGGSGGSGGATSGAGGGGGMGGAAGMGGSVGTAGGSGGTGTAGMAGMAGAGGSGTTSYRYVKLVANSEQNSAVWSAVAELQVMTTGGAMIARTAWTITADSQETDDEQSPATAAIDGNPDTFWHTAWEPAPNDVNDAKLPHSLTVDLGVARPITGFSYLPRQNNPNGRIKGWEFYVSANGTTWGTPVKAGTFPAGATLQTVSF